MDRSLLTPDKRKFSWNEIRRAPKSDHGYIYSCEDWYKIMRYRVTDTGGFQKLVTLRGEMYFVSQNTTGHTSPDWKIHFSIHPDDIGPAWDIMYELFIDSNCDFGMKVITPDRPWPKSMHGRELTVYIYTYDKRFENMKLYNEEEAENYLDPLYEHVYDEKFWKEFILEAENRLTLFGIRSNGLADGDMPLKNCRFASLRNEAFVLHPSNGRDEYMYPPNERGWNAANHANPFPNLV